MKVFGLPLMIGILICTITYSITLIEIASAFINDEIRKYPDINTYEDCHNGKDDDGDGLTDSDDSKDCF
jgi:hypothetical protein